MNQVVPLGYPVVTGDLLWIEMSICSTAMIVYHLRNLIHPNMQEWLSPQQRIASWKSSASFIFSNFLIFSSLVVRSPKTNLLLKVKWPVLLFLTKVQDWKLFLYPPVYPLEFLQFPKDEFKFYSVGLSQSTRIFPSPELPSSILNNNRKSFHNL